MLLALGRLSACPYLRPSFCSSVCPFICLSDCLSDRRTDFCSLSVFLIVCLSFVFIWRSVFLTLFLLVSLSVCLLVCLSVRLRVCLCVRQDFSLSGGLFVCAYVCPAIFFFSVCPNICFLLFVRLFDCLALCQCFCFVSVCHSSFIGFVCPFYVLWSDVLSICLSVMSISFLFACCLSEGCYSLFADTFLFFPFISVTYLSTHNHHSYLHEVTDEA